MEIRKIKIGKVEYQFVNNWRSNRSGFKHDTTLFRDGYELGDYSCQYYNRTWESYDYQTVMRACINDIISNNLERFISNYKYNNNISRLPKGKKAELEKDFANEVETKELREVYKELENRS